MNPQSNKDIIQNAGHGLSPSVAVVILNWNGRSYLEKFLPSVIKSSYNNYSVIVADNSSTDDSISFLRSNFPGVEVIEIAGNQGFAKGYNIALKQVKAKYLLLLNSDVEVSPGWIEPLVTLLEKDPAIAACQPKILSWHEKNKFEYAGASGGWLDVFGYPFTRGRVLEHCEEDHGQYDTAAPCFWATGAALFVRADVFHEMQGFDEYFFAHQEEIDLCWRMQLSGYKIYAEPASVVYHVGGGTLPKTNHHKTYLNYRNNMIMLYKNISWDKKLWLVPTRIILNAMAAVKMLVTGEGGYFLAVAKAHRHFIAWLLFHRKKSLFVKKKNSNLAGLYKGSILVDSMIKGKKRFSEIVTGK